MEIDEKFLPTQYWACDYLSMLGLKLIYVSKTGPWCLDIVSNNWSSYAWALTTILQYDNLQQKYIKQSVNVNSLDNKTSCIQAFRIAARHHLVLCRTWFNRNRSFNITPEFKVFAAISAGSVSGPISSFSQNYINLWYINGKFINDIGDDFPYFEMEFSYVKFYFCI